MTRDELLAALTAERFNNQWWKTPTPGTRRPMEAPEWDDSEVTVARRVRELLGEAYDDEREVG